MTDALITLGRKIKLLRKRKEISQEEFAEICGLDRTYISMIERGKRNISFINLVKVARGLGVSVSQLTEDIKNGSKAD